MIRKPRAHNVQYDAVSAVLTSDGWVELQHIRVDYAGTKRVMAELLDRYQQPFDVPYSRVQALRDALDIAQGRIAPGQQSLW